MQLQKCDEGDAFQKWEFPYMDKQDGERKKKISWLYQSNELAVHFQVEKQMKEFYERRNRAQILADRVAEEKGKN